MHKLIIKFSLLLLSAVIGSGLFAEDSWQDVSRIVAVGDVHGDYDNFFKVLQQAGIINRRGNWIAGETHLVQLGDVPDRGPDTDKVIDLLRKLDRQAVRDGGMVHALIGNHEAMNMLGDLRYVHPGEYRAFVDRNSNRLRERYYDLVVQNRKASDPEFEADQEFRSTFEEQIPPGYVEHRVAWSPGGDIGSWVLQHNAIIRINRVLFLHGGISPGLLAEGLNMDQINAGVKDELSQGENGPPDVEGLATAEDGPLWYRGLATNSDEAEASHVEAVLQHFDVDYIVIGHTPGLGTIVPRFGGKVLVIDSGISGYYGGHLSSLTIEDGGLFNTQEGERLQIPVGDDDPVPYFEAAAALEPDLEALQRYLQNLQQTD
ncbi:MAG: metallophosphoesterase [Gammaproteobacteria bacterium]|nr:metallophosphoesterase [Pseudomonadales bacterium]MCP5349193.1 metallophosphoesterase [Pseudomonadales bacterium]